MEPSTSGEAGRDGGGFVVLFVCSSSVGAEVEGAGADGGGSWMSVDQPLLMPSTSNPSRRTRILPQESQLGGTRILSRSMTLCLSVWRFKREEMEREVWMSVGRELGTEWEV